MWLLNQIIYPIGGRDEIVYENDYLIDTFLSYTRYYLSAYSTINGNFIRTREGGARVVSLKKYTGYKDPAPDITATARMPPMRWASPMPPAFLRPASLTRTT
jgi:hypothetical protein